MRVDGATNPELIQQMVTRLDLVADAALCALEACRHHQPHACRNASVGRITFFIFKTDRVDRAVHWLANTWVGAAACSGRLLHRNS